MATVDDGAKSLADQAPPWMAGFLRAQALLNLAIEAQESRPDRASALAAFDVELEADPIGAVRDLAARVDGIERALDSIHVTLGRMMLHDSQRGADVDGD